MTHGPRVASFGRMAATVTHAVEAGHRWVRRVVIARCSDPERRVRVWSVIAALGLMLFAVRVLGSGWPGRFAIFFPDSFSFKNAARHTPFSPSFYVAERPIAFPMLLFLLGRSTVVTVVVQTLLYGLAYLFAAFTIGRLLRRGVARIAGGFLILTVGLEPRFALWNTHILSESIGMTLALTSVLMWWRFSAAPSRRSLNWAGLVTVGWLTARDSNVPPWMAVGVPALLLASWLWKSADPRLRRSLRTWGLVTMVVCVAVTLSQSANGRNRYATINNVGTRVLPDDEVTQWFVDLGMPIDDALRARTGSNSFNNSWDMLTHPDLQEFRDWADDDGQLLMLISYLRFAPKWNDALDNDLPQLMAYEHSAYDAFGVANRLPGPAPAQINGPTTPFGLLTWTVLCVVALAVAYGRRRGVQSLTLGLLLLSTFVDLYMAYIGDSVEVARHMVGPLSRMAVVMVIILGVGIDSLLGQGRPQRRKPASQERDSSRPQDSDSARDGDTHRESVIDHVLPEQAL